MSESAIIRNMGTGGLLLKWSFLVAQRDVLFFFSWGHFLKSHPSVVSLLSDVEPVRGEISFNSHLFNILQGSGSLVAVMLMEQARHQVFFIRFGLMKVMFLLESSSGLVPESCRDIQLCFGWLDFYEKSWNDYKVREKFRTRSILNWNHSNWQLHSKTHHHYTKSIFCAVVEYVVLVWLFSSCNQCGRSSALPSRFYELELNIQGHKNLTECVTEFLKVTFIPCNIKCLNTYSLNHILDECIL